MTERYIRSTNFFFLPANIPAVSEIALLEGVLEVTAEKIDEIPAEIVVLGVQKADEGGVDGQLLGQLDGASGEDLEDVLLVVGQIGFQHGGQSFQIALQTRRAFLPHATDQRLQSASRAGRLRAGQFQSKLEQKQDGEIERQD